VGRGSNPQDVVACGGAWWVSRLGSSDLVAYDTEGRRVAQVDLSPWADADGLPEAGDMVSDGQTLDVVLQRLDRAVPGWEPTAHGTRVRIDCERAAVVLDHETPPNPGLTSRGDDRIVFGGDRIEQLPSDGPPIVLATLDATPTQAAFTDSGHGVIITVDEAGWYGISCLDPEGGITALLATDAFLTDAVATDRGRVWIGARRAYADEDATPAGVRIEPGPTAAVWGVDPVACTLDEQIPTELGPYSLTVY
jgi:hypothetical protein